MQITPPQQQHSAVLRRLPSVRRAAATRQSGQTHAMRRGKGENLIFLEAGKVLTISPALGLGIRLVVTSFLYLYDHRSVAILFDFLHFQRFALFAQVPSLEAMSIPFGLEMDY